MSTILNFRMQAETCRRFARAVLERDEAAHFEAMAQAYEMKAAEFERGLCANIKTGNR